MFLNRRFSLIFLLVACLHSVSAFADEPSVRTVLVRVHSVDGNKITLDDKRGTVVKIGDQVKFINTRGRETSVPDVRTGDSVILFINQENRYIFKISASPDDIEDAGGAPSYSAPEDEGKSDIPEQTYKRATYSVNDMHAISGRKSNKSNPFAINGHAFSKGIRFSMSDKALATYANKGDYDLFEASIGIKDVRKGFATVRFIVKGDDRTLFLSDWIETGRSP